jgi:peptidyl-dipeptidase Dcp
MMKIQKLSRNGANLAEDKKNKLREIDKELSKTSLQFGENVLAETHFELHITNDEDLSGLPEGTIEAARSLAKSQEKKAGSSDYPSYVPFVTYADNRSYARRCYCFCKRFPEQ